MTGKHVLRCFISCTSILARMSLVKEMHDLKKRFEHLFAGHAMGYMTGKIVLGIYFVKHFGGDGMRTLSVLFFGPKAFLRGGGCVYILTPPPSRNVEPPPPILYIPHRREKGVFRGGWWGRIKFCPPKGDRSDAATSALVMKLRLWSDFAAEPPRKTRCLSPVLRFGSSELQPKSQRHSHARA